MHELAVTENILEICLRHAGQANATRIASINLVIGDLSSIVGDSVQFYWDIIAKDSLAEGAKLNFERIEAEMTCSSCQHVFTPNNENFLCPKCSSPRVRVTKGEEFYVASIDIE
jgi:hydrogenase nickel incorporation protein HypA/HybF